MEQAQAIAMELLSFIADRLKVHLREQGLRPDVIAAAFQQMGFMGVIITGEYEDDLVRLLSKVRALTDFLANDDGANLLTGYRRAANIVRIEQQRDKHSYDRAEIGDLVELEEQRLARRLRDVRESVQGFGARKERALRRLDEIARRITPPSR